MDATPDNDEAAAVRARYARRAGLGDRYHPLLVNVLLARQQRERALCALLRAHAGFDLAALRVTEVGCGHGDNLLELLRLGFAPAHLTGIELLAERHAQARERLPAATRLVLGNAVEADVVPGSQDIVLQSTVFSSLLDDAFQQRLAGAMWRWLRPGGAVLWYDFAFDNPRNPDVRGVPLARVRALFPQGRIQARRVTLAPPLARAAVRAHPALHRLLDVLPWLRTHRLCWIAKPESSEQGVRS
ncbi:class I SAM-dependent methyltransferase [Azohydromonas aeria]|uniref:class I SAM-dependent methyltransferase n=1 Tax=Azohydromonas aeria TaxID=2590212 RepID=UPI0012F925F7|nr:class I SAM-dependent methyltransferase [Azohydromonas aeria]